MAEPQLITAVDELDALIERSHERPVFLFKHSLTCPISGAAHREYLQFLAGQEGNGEATYTLLEVQNARPLSNEIAQRTGLRHESPQAILLRDGRAVWNASHYSIRAQALAAALAG
jgi:bacillithiol system protein YtxJ